MGMFFYTLFIYVILFLLLLLWLFSKFLSFMTKGRLHLSDLIRAGLWSMLIIWFWKKFHPNQDISKSMHDKQKSFYQYLFDAGIDINGFEKYFNTNKNRKSLNPDEVDQQDVPNDENNTDSRY